MKATVLGISLLLCLLCSNLLGVTMNVDPSCGGHLVGPRGIVHTPNFPGPFSIPIKCRWVIDVSDIPSTNSSIVVYLTELYVYKGLRFTEYAYYESETMNFGETLVKEVTEGNVFGYRYLRTFRPFLVIEFELDRIEGSHTRVLNDLLDVYGFNVTYEMTEEHPNSDSCTIRDCSFTGNCLVSVDYTSFWCDCFNGFSGRNCNEGPLCFNDEHIPICQNGATCRQIGAEAMHCDCPDGYVGHNCETRLLDTSDTECVLENCILQCPVDEQEQPCTCKDSTKIYNNRSRYECRIKLSNVTSLRTGLMSQHGSLESFVSKQRACVLGYESDCYSLQEIQILVTESLSASSVFPVKFTLGVRIDKKSPLCTHASDGIPVKPVVGMVVTSSGGTVYKSRAHRGESYSHGRSSVSDVTRERVRLRDRYASVVRVCVRVRLSESGGREEAKRSQKVIQQLVESQLRGQSTTTRIRPTNVPEPTGIPTFSEVCRRGALRVELPNEEAKISIDMTRCQEPQSYQSQATTVDSGKSSWCEESRYYGGTVTCGMLPTLRELASRGCNSRGTVCLVPFDVEMDAASHLQMTLLEAYCREIGIEVLNVSKETMRLHLCPGSTDLSCVLISNKDSYFPKLPKLPK